MAKNRIFNFKKGILFAIASLSIALSQSAPALALDHSKQGSTVPPIYYLHHRPIVTSAGVVEYTAGSGTGLSAVYTKQPYFGIEYGGYQLTGNTALGTVGWNIPQYGQPDFSISDFIQASFIVISDINYSKDGGIPPFAIVLQTSDGFYHQCTGDHGHYQFIQAISEGHNKTIPAHGRFVASQNDFYPDPGAGTIVQASFVYQGTGTVGFTDAQIVGGFTGKSNQLGAKSYSFATTPDSKFNFQ